MKIYIPLICPNKKKKKLLNLLQVYNCIEKKTKSLFNQFFKLKKEKCDSILYFQTNIKKMQSRHI